MSFSDMMSSGRGPGLVGMLMALLVMIGFALLYLFSFDKEMQGGKSVASIIEEQREEIGKIKTWIQNGEARLERGKGFAAMAKEIAEHSRERIIRAGSIEGLTRALEELKGEYEAKAEEFANYKAGYRQWVRGQAKGETIPELVTVSGVVYQEVEIRDVSAIGMQIRHRDGFKRIAFEELPEEMKERFQFDEDEKTEALAKERVMHREHAEAVAAAQEEAAREHAALEEIRKEEAREQAIRDLTVLREQVAKVEVEIRALTRDLRRARNEVDLARGTGRTVMDRSKGIQQRLAAKQNQLSKLQARITALRSQL